MEYSGEEEFELIQDILDGRRELFRSLVDRYAPVVFYVVRKYEQDEDEVEELSQQIFVKAYERLNSFDMKARFSTWLYTLASNHCRDYMKNIRRQNKRFSELEQPDLESRLAESETPDHQLEQQQWQGLLNEALEKITADYAQAFLLKYRDDMTYQAMSERLGVTVSALKLRVHRGRKELMEYIQNKY